MEKINKDFLIQRGILLDEQTNRSLYQKSIHLGNDIFDIVQNEEGYFLKKSNNELYLYFYNQNIEFVNKTETDFFKKNSKFLILSDDICCSIFPYENHTLRLCEGPYLVFLGTFGPILVHVGSV